MNIIRVQGIKLHAYHGCMQEEAKVGAHYVVDVVIETDFSEAAKTDDLSKTVDYVEVYEIVKKEMAIRSKLIETVAKRIVDSAKKNLHGIKTLEVTVTKLNPPINGYVENTSVTIKE